MQYYRRFKVGDVVILLDGDALALYGSRQKDPKVVVIAFLKVAHYLRWYESPEKVASEILSCKPCITKSQSGKTIYANNKEVMYLKDNGKTEWCRITKSQLKSAISEWYYTGNNKFIPENAFACTALLITKTCEPLITYDEEDYKNADDLFIRFMEKNCQEAGEYKFDKKRFREETGLLSDGLVIEYLGERFKDYKFHNERLSIKITIVNRKEITITLE